jgi:hypothetical protein
MKPFEFRPGIGHNGAASNADCIAAIELWAKTRRVADALSVKELGELNSGARLVALGRSLLEAMAHRCRQNPSEDLMFPLLWAIYLLSDNEKGCCDMAQERLGRFFGRKRECIYEHIRELSNLGFIHIEGDGRSGKPLRLSPVVPRLFAKSTQTIWLFDALALYERAKPGRKPKDRGCEIPVGTAPTPIYEIPVGDMAIPISKYLSAKIEIPVGTAPTQDSYDSPSASESKNTPRANGCAFEGLQARAALPLVFDLQTVEAVRTDADRWGRKPGDPVFNPLPLATMQRELEALVAESQSSTAETIKAAIAEAHNELANMIDSGTVQAGNWKAALSYYRQAYRGARDRLDRQANDRKRALETANAIDAEKLAREKMITEKAGKAFDQSAALGIEAKQKRIEAGAAKGNGAASASRFIDERAKCVTGPDGKKRFGKEWKPFHLVPDLVGDDLNTLLTENPEAIYEDVASAIGRVKPMKDDRSAKTSAAIIEEITKRIPWEIETRIFKEAIKVYGTPEARCGGKAGRLEGEEFKYFDKVCLGQTFLDRMAAAYPEVRRYLHGMFESDACKVKAKDYAQPDFQQRFQSAFEKRLADRQAAINAHRKEWAMGFSRSEGCGIELHGELRKQLQSNDPGWCAFMAANDQRRFDGLPAEMIIEKINLLAELGKKHTSTECVNQVFEAPR